jgi:hypothetical protein
MTNEHYSAFLTDMKRSIENWELKNGNLLLKPQAHLSQWSSEMNTLQLVAIGRG